MTFQPSLSADGSLVADASDRDGAGNLDIWVQHVAGGDPIRPTTDPAGDLEPSLSPDGSRIVFRSERDGGGIYLIPTFAGEARLIAQAGRHPRLSPDGAWVAYTTGFGAADSDLWVIRSTGGSPRKLAAGIKLYDVSEPVWSPDCRYLIFQARGLDWCLIDLTGAGAANNVREILERSGIRFNPMFPRISQWLPNPDRILYEDIYENFLEFDRSEHRDYSKRKEKKIRSGDPAGFHRVEGRCVEWFLSEVPYLAGFVELAFRYVDDPHGRDVVPEFERLLAFRLTPWFFAVMGDHPLLERVNFTVLLNFDIVIDGLSYPEATLAQLEPYAVLTREDGPVLRLRLDKKKVVDAAAGGARPPSEVLAALAGKSDPRECGGRTRGLVRPRRETGFLWK